ncbi:MAG: hypothetical protein ACUZ9M_01760 [Candidatus Scalindua sp.]
MKTKMNKVLLPLLAFALLFSVGCDYASITAPGAIEAPVTTNALPADEINSGDEALSKKGGKKSGAAGSSSVSAGNQESTRYGWGF